MNVAAMGAKPRHPRQESELLTVIALSVLGSNSPSCSPDSSRMNTLLPVSLLDQRNPATITAVGVCAHPPSRATTGLYPISSIPSGMAQATAEVVPLTPGPYTVGSGNLNSPASPPPAVSYGLLSSVSAAPTELPPVTTTDSAAFGTMSAMLQNSVFTTISTITESPESTLATPASITETIDGIVTVTTPPLITSTGLTTLPDGAVLTTTRVIANPLQGASASSGNPFFANHPAAIIVLLGSGILIACLVALVYTCYRRRQRQAQRNASGSRLPEISLPLSRNPFADPVVNRTMREGAGDRFIFPGNRTSSTSGPLNRSQDSMPATNGAANTPFQPPLATRVRSRSSYRVPVPYSALDTPENNSRTTDQQYTDPFNEPRQVQAAQSASLPDIPPLPPMRSPLRLLATRIESKKPEEDARRLSRGSSPSVYPPSLRYSEGEVDSLYQREVVATSPSSNREASGLPTRGPALGNEPSSKELKREQVTRPSLGTCFSTVDSDGTHSFLQSTSSSSQAQSSLLRAPVSETGTALTSIMDEKVYRVLPRAPARPFERRVEHARSGAWGA